MIKTFKTTNLFKNLPDATTTEQFSELFRRPGLLVEQIVSHGQTTPDDEWYDQSWDEWILLLSGSAELLIDGESSPRSLIAGDSLLLPACCRHRVVSTATDQPTIWLAVHHGNLPAAAPEKG